MYLLFFCLEREKGIGSIHRCLLHKKAAVYMILCIIGESCFFLSVFGWASIVRKMIVCFYEKMDFSDVCVFYLILKKAIKKLLNNLKKKSYFINDVQIFPFFFFQNHAFPTDYVRKWSAGAGL